MKLTTSMRDNFVRAVLDDVPRIDYDEEFKTIATAHCLSRLPKEIVKVYNSNALRGFLNFQTISVRGQYWESEVSASLPLYDAHHVVKADLAALPEVQALNEAKLAQANRISQLRQDLKSAILSVSTAKQANELLPEFSKYLPQPDDKPTKFAPAVIANLAAKLTEAGWPKDKEAKAA